MTSPRQAERGVSPGGKFGEGNLRKKGMYRIESGGKKTKDLIPDKAHREKGISGLAFRN